MTRVKEIWDDWMTYDDDGFYNGIRPDAPDEVKVAYEKHLAELEAAKVDGRIPK